jgi:hypothetical protein
MAVEMIALLGAARAATGVLKESRQLVQEIRSSGVFRKNDEARTKLQEKLDELAQNLRDVGKLAQYGEAYTRRHEEVLELLWDSERARAFLKDNQDACNDSSHPEYTTAWRVLETIRESMDKRRDPALESLDASAAWYSDQDRIAMAERRQNLLRAFERASGSLRVKAGADARQQLDALIEQLEHVESALNRTLYDDIFHSLQELAA